MTRYRERHRVTGREIVRQGQRETPTLRLRERKKDRKKERKKDRKKEIKKNKPIKCQTEEKVPDTECRTVAPPS